jgi:putative membrane protein
MMKSTDVAFALKSAQCSQGEVRLGKLALEKATSPSIRAFGQQMIDEHSKAIEKLTSLAAKQNLTLPESLNADDQAIYTKLLVEAGAKFDHDYVKAMLNDRKDQAKACQEELKKGRDPLMKAFAEETLPRLQLHLQNIEAIRSGAGSSSEHSPK